MIKLFQNADEDRAYILQGLKFDNNFFLKLWYEERQSRPSILTLQLSSYMNILELAKQKHS